LKFRPSEQNDELAARQSSSTRLVAVLLRDGLPSKCAPSIFLAQLQSSSNRI